MAFLQESVQIQGFFFLGSLYLAAANGTAFLIKCPPCASLALDKLSVFAHRMHATDTNA